VTLEKIEALKNEIAKAVVGQTKMIDGLLIGLLTGGHILIEGVPGLAKTTTVNALAQALGLDFKRAQFTPDLLPADIIGAEIYDPHENSFKIKRGPIFTNLLLADEINRAPAKVQSALLEVMQEKQVTIGDETFKLDLPFFVMATQNPVEQEGVYQLPEAQLDRFMLKLVVGYNTKEEELEIARRIASGVQEDISAVISKDELQSMREDVLSIHMDEEIEKYIVNIIEASRNPQDYNLSNIANYIQFGASPRATIDLFRASRAMAYLRGKDYVTPVDVAYVVKDILRHRVIISYEAEAEDITADYIIDAILKQIPIP
jgi:MoxR-like ATPase